MNLEVNIQYQVPQQVNQSKHFEFDNYCLSCKLFKTSKCTFNKMNDGLLNWKKIGCNLFISEQK